MLITQDIASASMPTAWFNKDTAENSKKMNGFDQVFDVIQGMNDKQVQANQLMSDVILGKSDDTHGALIALEKAGIQMQIATKVRDELIQGYNKLINIQI